MCVLHYVFSWQLESRMLWSYRLRAYVYFVFPRIVTLSHCSLVLCSNETNMRNGHCEKSTRLDNNRMDGIVNWCYTGIILTSSSGGNDRRERERRYVSLTDNAEHKARDVWSPVVATDLTKQMTGEEHINACERDYAVSPFINDVSPSLCPSPTVEYTQMSNCLFTVVFVRHMCMIFWLDVSDDVSLILHFCHISSSYTA